MLITPGITYKVWHPPWNGLKTQPSQTFLILSTISLIFSSIQLVPRPLSVYLINHVSVWYLIISPQFPIFVISIFWCLPLEILYSVLYCGCLIFCMFNQHNLKAQTITAQTLLDTLFSSAWLLGKICQFLARNNHISTDHHNINCWIYHIDHWTEFIYVEESRTPLWSSGQSSWLQIQRSGFNSRRYHFLSSSGSGTVSTQLREYKWGATWKKE
jgi:hypothetical protein